MPSLTPESAREKRRLAEAVLDAYEKFDMARSEQRRFPREAFREFFVAVMAYAKATAQDELIDRRVASCLNGLREKLELTSRRTPHRALYDADRLETIFFAGYDPYFEGFEPPDPPDD